MIIHKSAVRCTARKLFSAVKYFAVAAVLGGLIFYNHVRIGGWYLLSFSNKVISCNWIPFKDFGITIERFIHRIPLKIAFFAIIAFLLCFILQQFRVKKGWCFWAASAGCMILLELLHLLTDGIMVHDYAYVTFDINNIIFYTVGALIGWGLWQGAKKLAASIEIVD